MRIITDFVQALSLPDSLKAELAGSAIMKQHALYVQLPTWLAPLFGERVSEAQVEQLSFSSYFYFRYLLAIDNLLDVAPVAIATLTPAAAAVLPQMAAMRLLAYSNLFERSVLGLAGLFPGSDPFWSHLDACKKHYATSNLHEKQMNAARGSFTLESFEALAEGKSAVCYAIVYALASLGGTTAPVAALLDCLKHIHVALQCMDDVEDFRADWEQGQYTYAHAQVEAFLDSQGLDARALTAEQVHPYLYISGTADALFALGQEHFRRAISLVQSFQLKELRGLLAHHVTRCDFYRNDIAKQFSLARERTAITALAA